MANKKHSNARVPKYDMYWVAAKDPFDPCPVYKVMEKHDIFDQRAWDEGRYFLSREEAMADVDRRRGKVMRLRQSQYAKKHSLKNKVKL